YAVYVARHTAAGWQELGGTGSGTRISGAVGYARQPSITLDALGNPFVVWTQSSGSGSDIEASDYDPTANGGSGGWVSLGNSLSAGGISGSGKAMQPAVVLAGGVPVVAWLDSTGGAPNVFVKRFVSGAWVSLGTDAASGLGVSLA